MFEVSAAEMDQTDPYGVLKNELRKMELRAQSNDRKKQAPKARKSSGGDSS